MSLLLKILNKINNNNIAINKKYNNNNKKIIEKNKRKRNRTNSQSSHSLNSLENSNKISEFSEDSLNDNINYRYLKGLHIDKTNFQSSIINKINIFMSKKKTKITTKIILILKT